MATRRLRILCIHGYTQNGTVFRSKSGAFRSRVGSLADFEFIDAPHLLPDDETMQRRTWWRSSDDGKTYGELDGTLSYLSSVLHDGAYDGVLGFSQGAVVAQVMLAAAGDKEFDVNGEFAKLRFGVLVSGFLPRATRLQRLLTDDKVQVPVLISLGEKDTLVPPEGSRGMARVNADSTVIEHVGGHIMSGRKDHGLLVRDFLTKQLEKITEEEELKRLAAEQDAEAQAETLKTTSIENQEAVPLAAL
eukprot:TRINITY_DN5901_c0_g1_i2.p1 TRINITY_DN5901_c0_g1~~TRINITY_DN5901_c0_g1_i2.p1  ORF type:complete len:247 (-),score=49.42 TRINITY_DN5901_c0_g1_i2:212-952(-)